MPDLTGGSHPVRRAELLIHSYFNIVKREMIDMVPKAISLTLVQFAKDSLQRELLQELYKPDVLDELLKESEFVVQRRKEVVSMVQALNKAEECVFFPSNVLQLHSIPQGDRLSGHTGASRSVFRISIGVGGPEELDSVPKVSPPEDECQKDIEMPRQALVERAR